MVSHCVWVHTLHPLSNNLIFPLQKTCYPPSSHTKWKKGDGIAQLQQFTAQLVLKALYLSLAKDVLGIFQRVRYAKPVISLQRAFFGGREKYLPKDGYNVTLSEYFLFLFWP